MLVSVAVAAFGMPILGLEASETTTKPEPSYNSSEALPEHEVSFKEDSALLLEAGRGGARFLHLNDCNTRPEELPKGVDVLATQSRGELLAGAVLA